MEKAIPLEGEWKLSQCDLHQHDCVLVADLTTALVDKGNGEVEASGQLAVVVQRLGGDHLVLSVKADDRVVDLKAHLQSSYGVALESQQLFVHQRMVEDDRTLAFYLQPPCQTLTLLLASPPPVLITTTYHRPIHFYNDAAIDEVRRCLQIPGVGRREVRGWGLTECADWLEEVGGKVGGVWAQVQVMGVKGVSATGLTWVYEEDEVKDRMNRWMQGGGGDEGRSGAEREEVVVDGEEMEEGSPVPSSADPALPVVEVIDLEGGEVGSGRRRPRGAAMRSAAVCELTAEHRTHAERRRRRRKGGAHGEVVDLVGKADEAVTVDLR